MDFNELMGRLGLTVYEKKVYLALLRLNEAKPQNIVKESDVPRGRVYDILESLIRKGLVTGLPTMPKKYKLNDPKKSIKSLIGEKEASLSKLKEDIDKIKIPQIILKNQTAEEFELVGSEEIYFQKYREFKNRAKNEYFALISGQNPPKYIGYETRQMLKRNVKSKTIIRELNKKNEKYTKEKIKLGAEIRIYPIKGIRFVIIDRKEILISIVNDRNFKGVTVYTTHKDFINSMVEFFNAIWKKSKIIK